MAVICAKLPPNRAFRGFVVLILIVPAIMLIHKELYASKLAIFKNVDISRPCIIPSLNPFDPVVKEYMWELDPLVCNDVPSLVFLDDEGQLQYNFTALKQLNIQETNIRCQYEILERQPNEDGVSFTSAVFFTPPHRVGADFYYVKCTDGGSQPIFDKLFSSIMVRETLSTKQIEKQSETQLNVLLFGVDSVSRSHSNRKLPKTVHYLKQLGAYDFEGYMKVGGNTFPNLIPVLTGRRAYSSELPFIDLGKYSLDSYPFLWKKYSERGYITMYAEDMFRFSTFKYLIKGFNKPPTDHYMIPFWQGLNAIENKNKHVRSVLQFLESRNIRLGVNSHLCYKNNAKHRIQIDYGRQFFNSYKERMKFAFVFFNEISHDFRNFLGYGDDDFQSFFHWFNSTGHLDNTVVVFFSDHGIKNEEFSYTDIGMLEERMPMLYIVVPEHIRSKYPKISKSMATNTKRLSTPFDLYQTLVDVLQQNFNDPGQLYIKGSLRGTSLFRPLPSDRSCADAWIPEQFCSCYTSSVINITQDEFVGPIAAAMLRNLNKRLLNEPLCAKFSLSNIKKAKLISSGLKRTDTEQSRSSNINFFKRGAKTLLRYQVVIKTTPGHAEFEGTSDIDPQTGDVTLIGDVNRWNRYGNQSICIQDRFLRPFCFCKDQGRKL